MSSKHNLKGPKLWPTVTRAFLADNASSLRSADTRKAYSDCLRALQRAYPDKLIADFTEDDIVEWVTSRDLAPRSIARYRTIISRCFEWATWQDLVQKDPTLGLKRRLKVRQRTVRAANWLSEAQTAAIIQAPDTGTLMGQRDSLVLAVGLFTGLRSSEIAGLRWGHVDLGERTISVQGKGDKPALVGIPDQLHELLVVHRLAAQEGLGRRFITVNDPVLPLLHQSTDFVRGVTNLTVRWDRSVGNHTIRRICHKYGAMIGVPSFAPHDMRRTFAGLLQAKGVPVERISKALRHDSITTTERYLEANPRHGVEAVADFRLAL